MAFTNCDFLHYSRLLQPCYSITYFVKFCTALHVPLSTPTTSALNLVATIKTLQTQRVYLKTFAKPYYIALINFCPFNHLRSDGSAVRAGNKKAG